MSMEHYESFADTQGDIEAFMSVPPLFTAPDEAKDPFSACCPLFGFEDEDDLRI